MEGNRSVTYSLLVQLLLPQLAFSTGSLINTGMLFMMNSGSTVVSLHTLSYKKTTKSHQMFSKAASVKLFILETLKHKQKRPRHQETW